LGEGGEGENVNDTISYYTYLGKSNGHRLVYHCLDVGAFVMAYGEKNPSIIERICHTSDIGLKHISALASSHDVGKFALCFQGINPSHFKEYFGPLPPPRYSEAVRHYRLGRALAKQILPSTINLSSQVLNAIFLHHGVPVTYEKAIAVCNFSQESIKSAKMFLSDAFAAIDVTTNFSFRPDPKISWVLAGLIVFCDWLASGHVSPRTETIPLAQYWQEILLHARSVLETLGIAPHNSSQQEGMKYLFPKIASPTPLQKAVSRHPLKQGPQLFIIEEPTGAGKTEAGTVLAHRLMKHNDGKRIYYGLPTSAMANSLYRRLSQAYEKFYEPSETKPSLILAHATSRMSEDFRNSLKWQPDPDWNAVCALWYADDRRKALLADVGIGTIDQALMGAMPKRFQSLRLFGLAGNILIVDEVHAYDSFTFTLVCALLRFHSAMGGSAVLLSATLPLFMRQQLVAAFWSGISELPAPELKVKDAYPLLTHLCSYESKDHLDELPGKPATIGREVSVKFYHNKIETEEFLFETAVSGKCACWIVNTIDDAIDAYERLIIRSGENGQAVNVMLFHSRFALHDRQRIEAEVEKYFGANSTAALRANRILVATQVVEQSLDLDFDELAIDLCPIDIVIQRMGRLRRHNRSLSGDRLSNSMDADQRGTPNLVIHSPEFDSAPSKNWYSSSFKRASGVYPDHGRLWKTASLLQEKFDSKRPVVVPDDVRTLIEQVYDVKLKDKLPDSGILDVTMDAEIESQCKKSIASQSVLICHQGYSNDAYPFGNWDPYDSTPTRMGKDVRIDVYLSVLNGNDIVPLYSNNEWPWEMSRVQVSVSKVKPWIVAGIPPHLSVNVFNKALESLPGKGQGGLLLVLKPDGKGGYVSQPVSGKVGKLVFSYSPLLGAHVRKEVA
jgi:CRISPR-associated endonuclease/helicase Cas3